MKVKKNDETELDIIRFKTETTRRRIQSLIRKCKETGTGNCHKAHYLCLPYQNILLMNMVRTSVQGKMRMRKQNTKTTVPLDVAPERRTKRCSPRFRPGGRFWGEPRFRYLSPGSEGEKCRPLDHLWQTPFIHLARFISSSSFHIYRTVFYFSPPFGTFRCLITLPVFP